MTETDKIQIEAEYLTKLFVFLLKKKMEEKRLTPLDIERKTGLKRQNIYRLLSGNQNPNLKTFITIARSLDIDLQFDTDNQDLNYILNEHVKVFS